jgi:putative RNA 2'-phosphotransferase
MRWAVRISKFLALVLHDLGRIELTLDAEGWADVDELLAAAASARRSNAVTGNNTCVARQPVHRDRRGHSRTGPCGPRLSRPGPPPARQHAAACRAAQLARRQPPLDRIDIHLYRDHCASKRERTALPQTPARDTGRAVAYNDVITVPPRHHKDQTQV